MRSREAHIGNVPAATLKSMVRAKTPLRTILVTDATYQCLRDQYTFQPSQMIRVKGKGEVLSYRLVSII